MSGVAGDCEEYAALIGGAAGGGDGSGDGSDGGSGGDDGSSDSGSGGNADAPEVLSADAWCYLHSTGDKAYYWGLKVQADDPQGSDTLETFFNDAVTISINGVEVTTQPLVCTTGECTHSFAEADDGIACSNATAYEFSIQVMDIDENWSEPLIIAGRQGSSAKG